MSFSQPLILFPALDLLEGACVRLRQGEFEDSTRYSSDPLDVFKKFQESGASQVHLVDLSGARDPSKKQIAWIHRLIASTSMKVQTGGGIRSRADAEAVLNLGAERVVVGSMALKAPQDVSLLLKEYGGNRITVALDVRVDAGSGQARVAVSGWKEQSTQTVQEVIEPLLASGLKRILCTDISRDGMMQGPNVKLYASLVQEFPMLEIQASGGVGQISDLVELRKSGVHSVIVGKALYEGAIVLEEAIRICGAHAD